LGFQPSQERLLQGLKWSIPSGVVWAQWFVTRSLQKTFVGLASALMVAGVAPVYTMTGQEAFVTGRAWDPPLCENIQDSKVV
jgi:hypothetical protein